MLDGRHDGPVCGGAAFEFIDYHPARLTALAFQLAAEEVRSRLLIASALHQNIKGIAILIHGSPEILRFSFDEH